MGELLRSPVKAQRVPDQHDSGGGFDGGSCAHGSRQCLDGRRGEGQSETNRSETMGKLELFTEAREGGTSSLRFVTSVGGAPGKHTPLLPAQHSRLLRPGHPCIQSEARADPGAN